MKLLTKLKLGLEGIIHEVSLDWRVESRCRIWKVGE